MRWQWIPPPPIPPATLHCGHVCSENYRSQTCGPFARRAGSVTHAGDRYADVKDGESGTLTGHQCGTAQILWSNAASSDPWAIVCLGMAARARYFELKTALLPGLSATAHFRFLSGGSYETDTDEDKESVVDDTLGVHRGRGRSEYDSPHATGSCGIAVEVNGRYEIVDMQPHALWIAGQATADFSGGTLTINNVAVVQPIGGLITDQDTAGSITVHNKANAEGSAGALLSVMWNDNWNTGEGRWELITPVDDHICSNSSTASSVWSVFSACCWVCSNSNSQSSLGEVIDSRTAPLSRTMSYAGAALGLNGVSRLANEAHLAVSPATHAFLAVSVMWICPAPPLLSDLWLIL